MCFDYFIFSENGKVQNDVSGKAEEMAEGEKRSAPIAGRFSSSKI